MQSKLIVGCALVALCAAPALASGPDGVAPDNTGTNARDADGTTLTVFDQGESDADRRITAEVRQMLVADDSLSTNAQNVKVITLAGVVTLRGPVASADEKASVESKARSVAGVTRVDNHLDITTN